jgi:alkyldihydroxyacetonephosphate synthase
MTSVRWWGWLEPRRMRALAPAAIARLEDELGGPLPLTPPVALEAVDVPPTALPERFGRRLREIAPMSTDRLARIRHAAGKGYADLVRMRSGDARDAPDAVVFPGTAAETAAVLELCSRERVAVVPFGGGTSVVGGVTPERNRCAAAISLDLGRMDRLTVDRTSLTATFGPGLSGPRAEARLQGRGLTLGHFPQSFELATIGGYVATRSAGQASTGYGRIDELVHGLRLVAPAGELNVKDVPASAAGPSLREVVVGSEGTLGVIAEATLTVRPLPDRRRYEGWSFETFAGGVDALRALAQTGAEPDVARLSDSDETRLTLALGSGDSVAARAGRLYLRARGHAHGCLAILGYEGDASDVERRRRHVASLLRGRGALALGTRPGSAWLAARYAGPYTRDQLLDRGLMVETLETAATWAHLDGLYRAVREAIASALAGHGTPGLVGCHVSHLYRAGASLYFTFIARADRGAPLDQWLAVKRAAGDAIAAHGGTITHHHGVGRDHLPWMRDEVGELGIEVLAAAKERLDPAGIMNPGKLLPIVRA